MKKINIIYRYLRKYYTMFGIYNGKIALCLEMSTTLLAVIMLMSWALFVIVCSLQCFGFNIDAIANLVGWTMLFDTPAFLCVWFTYFLYDRYVMNKRDKAYYMNTADSF